MKVMRSGQVMILTVLALGGTLLGATTVAGLLTLYQIRNSTDLANSAKAIFAADAGVEWGLYNAFCASTGKTPCPVPPLGGFSNDSSVEVICQDGAGEVVNCEDPGIVSLKAIGSAGGSSRAFEASF
jgi:hypothetical protein